MRVLEAAQTYTRMGYRCTPIHGKDAFELGWQKMRLAESDLPAHFSNGNGVGILCGEPSGGLGDVDCDVPEAVEAARELLPPTGMIHGRPGKPTSHYWYIAPGVKTKKFQFTEAGADKATMIAELRSTGCQTAVYPSPHPDGGQYTWEGASGPSKPGEPATVAPAVLRRQVARVAACALIARHWPGVGSRDDAAMALAGMLLRAGWTADETDQFTQLVARLASDDEWPDRDKAEQTARKLSEGEKVSGAPTLARLLRDGGRVLPQVREWLELKDAPRSDAPNEDTKYELNAEKADGGDNAFNSYFVDASPYPTADQAMYYGLAGDIVGAIEPHSEADPVALLMQLLAAVGNAAGRHAYFAAEADRHYPNLYAVIVGSTSKGRKGVSWGQVRDVMLHVAPDWVADHILPGGLSSGEGVIHTLRDVAPDVPITETGSAASLLTDKRLFVQEGEFASVLRMFMRDSNILSAVLRQAWDGHPLQTLTKHSPERASNTHISIVGHITKGELLRYLSETDAANGVGNRFLWICSTRSKVLPFGGDDEVRARTLAPLYPRLRRAIEFASKAGQLRRDADARELWRAEYERLSEGHPGLLGAMTARAEAQVMRLACLYALLDCSDVISVDHLRAALALWDYAEASARHIFGDALGDPIADRILYALRDVGEAGMSRTDIYALFGRNVKAKELTSALRALLDAHLARYSINHPDGQGRPTERWFAVSRTPRSTKNTHSDGAATPQQTPERQQADWQARLAELMAAGMPEQDALYHAMTESNARAAEAAQAHREREGVSA